MLSLPTPAPGKVQGAEGRGHNYSTHKRVFGRSDLKCVNKPGAEKLCSHLKMHISSIFLSLFQSSP